MSNDYRFYAKEFLTSLSQKEQSKLYNDLLAVQEVHRLNSNNTYYTFKNLQTIAKRHSQRRKRSFCYCNGHNDELMIHQIHEQHFFKNTYKFQLFLNCKEFDYRLVDLLLSELSITTQTAPSHYRAVLI